MSAITGFTYTLKKARKIDASPSVKEMTVKLQAGDGSLTYPTGGIPLDKASLGLPNYLEALEFVDTAAPDGYVYKYDNVNNKILMYQCTDRSMADGPLVEVGNTATPTVNFHVIAKGF